MYIFGSSTKSWLIPAFTFTLSIISAKNLNLDYLKATMLKMILRHGSRYLSIEI